MFLLKSVILLRESFVSLPEDWNPYRADWSNSRSPLTGAGTLFTVLSTHHSAVYTSRCSENEKHWHTWCKTGWLSSYNANTVLRRNLSPTFWLVYKYLVYISVTIYAILCLPTLQSVSLVEEHPCHLFITHHTHRDTHTLNVCKIFCLLKSMVG